MLSAVLHGKKLGTGFAGKSLKIGEVQGAEDVLTASVFERIAYLPDEVFICFMQNLLGSEVVINALDQIEFWAGWQGRSIEPDVVLKLGNNVIIVEAKRHDHHQQQYAEQLAKQIQAAYAEEITNPVILAIGGMGDYSKNSVLHLKSEIDTKLDKNLNYSIYAKSWQQLYLALQMSVEQHQSKPLYRMLNDIREVYAWHGIRYQPRLWLETIDCQNADIRFTSVPKFSQGNFG